MRNRLFLLLAFLLIGGVSSGQGVAFRELTYAEALEAAKTEKKMIFMDCYTSWCGPCKIMANSVFTQKRIGDVMNRDFICVKYDMEKGEGPELRKKLNVTAYPTFLLIDETGKMVHKFVGSRTPDEFLRELNYDPKEAFGPIQERYEKGDRSKEFLLEYLNLLLETSDKSAGKVAGELFATLNDEEKLSKKYFFLFDNMKLINVGSETYNYLLANRAKYNEKFGQKRVDVLLQKLSTEYLRWKSFAEEPMTDTERAEVETHLATVNLPALTPFWEVVQACRTRDLKQIIKVCQKNFPQMDRHLCADYYSMFLANLQKDGTKAQQKACAAILEQIKERGRQEIEAMMEAKNATIE